MAKVKMYTTQVCPYCVRAKQLLHSRGVTDIEEVRIDLDPAQRDRNVLVIGNSMGGMTALAYLHLHPGAARAHINVSGSARALPFSIAIRSLQLQQLWWMVTPGNPLNLIRVAPAEGGSV